MKIKYINVNVELAGNIVSTGIAKVSNELFYIYVQLDKHVTPSLNYTIDFGGGLVCYTTATVVNSFMIDDPVLKARLLNLPEERPAETPVIESLEMI